jgi:hypothetical protein
MTSEQIKQTPATDLSTNGWLREIAMQLALLNEKDAVPEQTQPERVKRAYTKRT